MTTIASDRPAPTGTTPPAPGLTRASSAGGPTSFGWASVGPATLTMVVFFPGLHCPVCRAQRAELDRRLDQLSARGIDVIAVSAEARERSEQLQADWKRERLPIAYGLSEPSMGEWGPFVSRGRSDDETGALHRAGAFPHWARRKGLPRVDPSMQPSAGLDSTTWVHAIDYRTQVGGPARGRRLTVCDTRTRSTQKGRMLHRDISAIRLSGEHDRHQAGHPKWRNQPTERQRRRTARRLVRPVRAGSARRRSGTSIQACAHTSRQPASSTRRPLKASDWSMIRSPRTVMARADPVGSSRA